jgi:acyl-coenzyme A synthetase/AMP-(fatty) acid ligase
MHWRASDLIDRLAHSKRPGLIFIDEYGHRRDYTFAEIAKLSKRYAAAMRAFGIGEDHRVYVALTGTPRCAFILLALQRLNAQAIFDAESAPTATAVITNRERRPAVEKDRARFSEEMRYLLIGEECEGWVRIDTVAQIAAPIPGVQLPVDQEQFGRAYALARQVLGADDGDVVWCTVKIDDVDWFERAIVQPWLAGATAVVYDHAFDPRERLDLLRELEVSVVLQRAEEYEAQLALPEPLRFKMPRLRRCLLIDGRVDDALQERWNARFGISAANA